MKILSIGNSFSGNATKYLHRLAAGAGENIRTVNLFIGGCSLRTHYLNMLEDAPLYAYYFNGESTGLKVSIKQALMSDEWDYITLQQASPLSPHYTSYQPYLTELAAYVRKYCPHSKLLIHQTWAYEDGSEKLLRVAKFETAEAMLNSIRDAYAQAAASIEASGIIPCGEAMYRTVQNGIKIVHADGSHASAGVGCYLLALTWYGYLTGKPVDEVPFRDFSVPVTEEEIAIAKKSVAQVLGQTE